MPEDQDASIDRLKELLGKIDPEVLKQLMPPTGGVITMMFTDIVDSTRIKAEMGDQPFFDKVLKPHNDVIRECLSKHNGRELKTIGDAFFVGFADPEQAVACASEIQERLTVSPIQAGPSPLKVRIGLHTGMPKVYRDDVSKLIDLSGTAVDKAARVEGLARGGQILVSEETTTLAKPKEAFDWGPWELKGLGRHRIFEALWPGKIPERPVGHPWLTPIRFPTKFVGREKEIVQVMDAILNHPLVTLRAMGGIGKTRLADEVAARVSQSFDDGIFIIELANTQNAEAAVVSEILVRLSINPAGFADEATAILTTLQNWRALLVLDNFEAVMSAAMFVGRLLKGCPSVHILVTSQQLLGLGAEQQIEVQPMAAAVNRTSVTVESLAQLDSFQLFRERARLKKPDWDVSPANAAIVAEILELTDGIPLSIELAAAWVGEKALMELRDGLKKNRSEYLRRSGPGVDEKRHSSIEACIDWSFKLLSPEEQALFLKLSVFVGGFFADDVAQVCQAKKANSLLNLLYGHSLLLWEESLGKTRYKMLPTIQEYADEKLEKRRRQVEELRQRHTQHYLDVLDQADRQIRTKEEMKGLATIAADLDNIRAGMQVTIIAGAHRMVVRYSRAFSTFLLRKSYFPELLQRNVEGLKAAEAMKDPLLVAGCHSRLGVAYTNLPAGRLADNLQKAIICCEEALQVFTERDFPAEWAGTLNNLGNAYGDLPIGNLGESLQKAIDCFEAALRVWTRDDFPLQSAMTNNNLGIAYKNLPIGDRLENLKKAIGCFEAALQVRSENDYPVEWAGTTNNLGNACVDLPIGNLGENLQKAIDCFEAALRVFTEHEFPLDWAGTQNNLGNAYRRLPIRDPAENLQKAIACYKAALRVFTEQQFPAKWATTQNNLAAAYADLPTGDREKNVKKATACYEAAIRGFESAGLKEEAEEVKERLTSLKGQPRN